MRQYKTPPPDWKCDCGAAATVRSNGAWTCERCRDLDKPCSVAKKTSGIRGSLAKGATSLDWENYNIPAPIAGVGESLRLLDKMMRAA